MRSSVDFELEAESLPDGIEKGRLLERAAELSELDGDTSRAFALRYAMLRAQYGCAADEKVIGIFSWMARTIDREPEVRAQWTDSFMWLYKWVLNSCQRLSAIPRGKIEALHGDYERRVRALGYSLYSVYQQRMDLACYFGELDQAEDYWRQMRTHSRDDHCDCEACVPSNVSTLLRKLGRHDEAWHQYDRVICGELSCDQVPSVSWPRLAVLALNAGDESHAALYANAWSETLTRVEITYTLEDLIHYMWRRGLWGDFRHYLRVHANPTFFSVMNQVPIWRELDAALVRFAPHFAETEFLGPMRITDSFTVSTWAELAAKAHATVAEEDTRFDRRNRTPHFCEQHQARLERAESLQSEPVHSELTTAASSRDSVASAEEDVRSESFAEFAQRFRDEIESCYGWEDERQALAGLDALALLEIVRDGEADARSYAALRELAEHYADSVECVAATAHQIYNDWRPFMARAVLHYREDVKGLDMLLPEVLRWPSDLTDYLLRRLVELTAGAARSRYVLRTAEIAAQRYEDEQALALVEQVEKAPPTALEDQFALGQLLNHLGAPERALDLWPSILEQTSGEMYREALLGSAYTFHQLQDYAAAEDTYRTCLGMFEEPPVNLLLALTASIRQQDRPGDALPFAKRALEASDWETGAFLEIGHCQFDLAEFAEAARNYAEVYQFDDSLEIAERYALALRYAEDYAEAATVFRTCLTMAEEEEEPMEAFQFGLAFCMIAARPSPTGRRMMRELILGEGEFAADAFSALKEDVCERDGVASWSRVVALLLKRMPNSTKVITERAWCLHTAGKIRDAHTLLEAHRDDDQCLAQLAMLQTDRDAALDLLPLDRVAGSPWLLFVRWDQLAALERWAEAEQTLHEVAELLGEVPSVAIRRADQHVAQEEYAKADAILDEQFERLQDLRILERRLVTLEALGDTEQLAAVRNIVDAANLEEPAE